MTILPLGDSVTWGYTPVVTPTGGYRSRLYEDFAAHGQSIKYEGSVYDKYSKELENSGNAQHEGHGGYWIPQIDEDLDGSGADTADSDGGGHWLTGTGSRPAIYPDAILLMAGTNDIHSNHEGGAHGSMDALIHKITTERPNTVLFVSTVIPLADPTHPTQNADVQAFNNQLRTVLVPKYQKLGARVVLVDQYSNFIDANSKVEANHLPDGVHPDRTGYDRMGDTWYAAIQQYEAQHPGVLPE